MKRRIKKMMIIIISVLVIFSLAVVVFMQQAKFGKHPTGDRLARIEKSPNYKNGEFQNLNATPVMAETASYFTAFKEFIKSENATPNKELPSVKTDLHKLDKNRNILVWFGHSSYFMQLGGKSFLVDPVLSGAASPISFTVNAFKGTDVYKAEDIPKIDYLLITHDHWDHLDYETIRAIKDRVGTVICGLGVGEHLEYWGYDVEKIIENDWYDETKLSDSLTIHTLPTRHFSGRDFKRNKTLWVSFLIKAGNTKLFVGGDGGYDTHFAKIGENFGELSLAVLENGQYNENWKYIHTMPNQFGQIISDLKAKQTFPVHSGKFKLANHAWDEPLKTVLDLNKEAKHRIITPIIGEVVNINDTTQQYSPWWEKVN